MTNVPSRVGDRYRCFILIKPDITYGGSYGQAIRFPIWECEDCGYRINAWYSTFLGDRRWSSNDLARMADHHECGHAPCAWCGRKLLRRKDGTPRQHAHNRCPGKSGGHRVEREFTKNIREREYQ